MRLSFLLLLTATGNTNVCAFPEGFFTKLTNFFRRKPTVPPSETTITYRRYQSPDDDLFGGVPPERNPSASCQTGQVYVEQAGACMIVQYPGQPCQYSEQCNGAEQGAYCLRLRCECPYGMTISGMSCAFSNPNCKQREHIWIEELGECKPVISPGLKGCSHSSQCSSAYMGTHCVHQMCTCPPPLYPVDGTCGQRCPQGHTYSSIAGECLPSESFLKFNLFVWHSYAVWFPSSKTNISPPNILDSVFGSIDFKNFFQTENFNLETSKRKCRRDQRFRFQNISSGNLAAI
ncbi:unnamed protein product [Toxocara canis]|uniref:EB domain-containing protein n=1 Tax=Toxocara canis TaxID=6265 RepID=A0A183UQL2_TOXCA|nr:unnamed protein product [Toxocara canis]